MRSKTKFDLRSCFSGVSQGYLFKCILYTTFSIQMEEDNYECNDFYT